MGPRIWDGPRAPFYTICMISPFSIEEKQKLLETVEIEDNLNTLEEIVNFNLLDNFDNKTIQ